MRGDAVTAPAYDPRKPYGIGNGAECHTSRLIDAVLHAADPDDDDDALDPDGENTQRRAEVATIRAETRARGGHVELAR